jgi:hypothetical protein
MGVVRSCHALCLQEFDLPESCAPGNPIPPPNFDFISKQHLEHCADSHLFFGLPYFDLALLPLLCLFADNRPVLFHGLQFSLAVIRLLLNGVILRKATGALRIMKIVSEAAHMPGFERMESRLTADKPTNGGRQAIPTHGWE